MSAIAGAITPVLRGAGFVFQGAGIIIIFAGAYFFSAHFNWREAVAPPIEVVSTRDLTPEQFTQVRTKLRPDVEAACLRRGKIHFGVDGKVPSFVSDFCACYATTTVATMTKEELLYQAPSPTFRTRVEDAVALNCKTISPKNLWARSHPS
jgi:hypothetical protein